MPNTNPEPLMPGDDITLGFEFDHEQHLESVTVVFAHEDHPKQTLVLSAYPVVAEHKRTTHGVRAYRSKVRFQESIEAGYSPGRYVFQSVEFHTIGGQLLTTPDELNPLAGIGFAVGQEGTSKPLIIGLT